MSPEQIRSAKHVDHRTDVWAMAVVLYEMLTADLPFLGDNAHAMLAAISADKHIPVAHFLPDVPPGLEAAIGNALKKNRDQRTPSVAAFAEAIAPYALESSGPSLVAIRAILARGPQWNDQSSKRSAPVMPLADAVAATMHADPPMLLETPRHAAVSRTDRDAILSTQRMSPMWAAIVTGIIVAAVTGHHGGGLRRAGAADADGRDPAAAHAARRAAAVHRRGDARRRACRADGEHHASEGPEESRAAWPHASTHDVENE